MSMRRPIDWNPMRAVVSAGVAYLVLGAIAVGVWLAVVL